MVLIGGVGVAVLGGLFWLQQQKPRCPANATLVGSSCQCNSGYQAQDGKCVALSACTPCSAAALQQADAAPAIRRTAGWYGGAAPGDVGGPGYPGAYNSWWWRWRNLPSCAQATHGAWPSQPGAPCYPGGWDTWEWQPDTSQPNGQALLAYLQRPIWSVYRADGSLYQANLALASAQDSADQIHGKVVDPVSGQGIYGAVGVAFGNVVARA